MLKISEEKPLSTIHFSCFTDSVRFQLAWCHFSSSIDRGITHRRNSRSFCWLRKIADDRLLENRYWLTNVSAFIQSLVSSISLVLAWIWETCNAFFKFYHLRVLNLCRKLLKDCPVKLLLIFLAVDWYDIYILSVAVFRLVSFTAQEITFICLVWLRLGLKAPLFKQR